MEIFVYGTNPGKYVLTDEDRACIEEVCGLYFAALSKYAEECGVSLEKPAVLVKTSMRGDSPRLEVETGAFGVKLLDSVMKHCFFCLDMEMGAVRHFVKNFLPSAKIAHIACTFNCVTKGDKKCGWDVFLKVRDETGTNQ